MKTKKQKISCASRLCDTFRCNFARGSKALTTKIVHCAFCIMHYLKRSTIIILARSATQPLCKLFPRCARCLTIVSQLSQVSQLS